MNPTTRGLVIVNTGNGKGKTTAALGIMLRAWGNNMRVVMLQFVKHATVGEHQALQRIGLEILAGGAGFTAQGKNGDKQQEEDKLLPQSSEGKRQPGLLQQQGYRGPDPRSFQEPYHYREQKTDAKRGTLPFLCR